MSHFIGDPRPHLARRRRSIGATPRPEWLEDSDPSRWPTGVPTDGQVAPRNVYPGIDLVDHGSRRDLEYDFVVAPGADPGVTR
jgi:hypothetical protein